jgi:DNA-binding NtrC family response regulator
VIRISLPPLRDRTEDIPALAHQFWRRAASESGTRATLRPDALARLVSHPFPGNIRELQNVIAALAVLAPHRGRVGASHVDQVIASTEPHVQVPVTRLEAARMTLERRVVSAALVRNAGRRAAAARELGLTRQGLTKALRRLGISDDEPTAGVA